jgi:hypothetical protein
MRRKDFDNLGVDRHRGRHIGVEIGAVARTKRPDRARNA